MIAATDITVTALFAGILGILHVVFTLRVGMYRLHNKISIGDGGDRELLKRMRGHGNFIENTPIALILLLLNELSGLANLYLMALGATFVFGRVMHYIHFAMGIGPFVLRPIGMLSTLGAIAVSAVLLLI